MQRNEEYARLQINANQNVASSLVQLKNAINPGTGNGRRAHGL
jgi:hypothetical protein